MESRPNKAAGSYNMTQRMTCPACLDGYRRCTICYGGTRSVICHDCEGSGLYYDPDAEKVRECLSCEGEGSADSDSCRYCVSGQVLCEVCSGSGHIGEDACQICGDGQVTICPPCQGTGDIMSEADVLEDCGECGGTGLVSCPMHH